MSSRSSHLDGLRLRRPLAVLDLETTGTSITSDRIVEIAVLKLYPDGNQELRRRRINPGVPIPPRATEIHGIRDVDVAGEPTFRALARSLHEFLRECDFAGFNVSRFDLPLLRAEFAQVGLDFSWNGCAVIDAMAIFHAKERRDLAAAVTFYCGRAHPRPHSASDDVEATLDVLLAQLERYADLPRDVDALHQFCHPQGPDAVDAEGKLIWVNGTACIGFGKYQGIALSKLAQDDPGYLEWMLRADFSDEVMSLVRDALTGTLSDQVTPASDLP